MKRFFLVSFCMLIGCGREAQRSDRPNSAADTPSEAVPLPDSAPVRELSFARPPDPPAEITDEKSWPQRQADNAEQLQRLRDYAAKAAPDDPFALSEKRIEELAKRQDLIIE